MAKKKKKDTMSGLAIGGGIAIAGVGASASLGVGSGISANFAAGVGNVGKTLPTLGKLKGTGMVLKQTGKLSKAAKKVNVKGYRGKKL